MASSAVETETIDLSDEKEEGEISLEDVSSSEEGQGQPRYGGRNFRHACPTCLSTQHCATWCTSGPLSTYSNPKRNSKRDAVQGKENRHRIKESGFAGGKAAAAASVGAAATLQEKNDDLDPISSDTDMEVVGPAESPQHAILCPTTKYGKPRKKKKKKRHHANANEVLEELSEIEASKRKFEKESHYKNQHRTNRSTTVQSRLSTRKRASSHSPSKSSKSPMKSPSQYTLKELQSLFPHPPRKIIPRRDTTSPDIADFYGDTRKLLKKVRTAESIGLPTPKLNKPKEHALSLKEKLNILVTGQIDSSNNNVDKKSVQMEQKEVEDADDEEDLALLRQRALETKQKKLKSEENNSKSENECRNLPTNLDDIDEEDLELRMIALKSAVLSKHKNRLKKGFKSTKSRNNYPANASPFTESFLENIPLSDREVDDITSISPVPSTYTEDMELDTDVEREKELYELPYSPTDEVSEKFSIEEQNFALAMENRRMDFVTPERSRVAKVPSDVENRVYVNGLDTPYSPYYISQNASFWSPTREFINGIDTPHSPTGNTSDSESVEIEEPFQMNGNLSKGDSNASKLDSYPTNGSGSTPYSPSRPTETPILTLHSKNDEVVENAADSTPQISRTRKPTKLCPAIPDYPVSVVPNGDPELLDERIRDTDFAICQNGILNGDEKFGKNQNTMRETAETKEDSDTNSNEKSETIGHLENLDEKETGFHGSHSPAATLSPSESLITLDDLPDSDEDSSQEMPKNVDNLGPSKRKSLNNADIAEPLYLRGVPDVTKDANKIPTLLNKSLVPSTILKTNKQLQQPLQPKKQDANIEVPQTTFKSAEMQPLDINVEESAKSNFKPMKLNNVCKKPSAVIAKHSAFFTAEEEKKLPNNFNEVLNVKENIEIPVGNREKGSVEKGNFSNEGDAKVKDDGKKRRDTRRRSSTATMKISVNELTNSKKNAKRPSEERSIANNKSRKNNVNKKNVKPKGEKSRRRSEGNGKRSAEREVVHDAFEKKRRRSCDRTLRISDTNEQSSGKKHGKDNAEKLQCHGSSSSTGGKSRKSLDGVSRDNKEGARRKSLDQPKDLTDDSKESDRRNSLDEDEEELRALLLASLAKRSRATDQSSTQRTDANSSRVKSTSEDEAKESLDRVASGKPSNISGKSSPAAVGAVGVDAPTTNYTTSKSRSNLLVIQVKDRLESAVAASQEKVPPVTIAPKAVILNSATKEKPNSATSLPQPIRKRTMPSPIKGPVKKVMKKTVTPLSIRVVNNAKRYQNALTLKKLNSQKAVSLLYNIQKPSPESSIVTTNKILNNLNIVENRRTASPMPPMNMSSEINRFIISLGSDSDSEVENDQPVDDKGTDNGNVMTDANNSESKRRQPLNIPTSDFEKSVDQFLREARKKLESKQAAATAGMAPPAAATSNLNNNNNAPSKKLGNPSGGAEKTASVHTPLAVRHLPVSQQEEYRRLKQQIFEREKLKMQRAKEATLSTANATPAAIATTSTSQQSILNNNKAVNTPLGPLSPASPAPKSPLITKKNSNAAVDALKSNSISAANNIQENVDKCATSAKVATTTTTAGVATVTATTAVAAATAGTTAGAAAAAVDAVPKTSTPDSKNCPDNSEETNINVNREIRPATFTPPDISTRPHDVSVEITKVASPLSETSKASNIPNEPVISEKKKQETLQKEKTLPFLKILTKDEVNLKYLRIQVKQNADGRTVVTEKPKPAGENSPSASLNDKTEETNVDSPNPNVMAQHSSSIDRTISSNASTVVLGRSNSSVQIVDDTLESTVLVSPNQMNNDNTVTVPSQSEASTPEDDSTPKENRIRGKEVWENIKKDVALQLESISTLSEEKQRQHLMETEQQLVNKRYILLDDLSEMSGTLRKWEMEKELQASLFAEVKNLRRQLQIAEEKLQEQRKKVSLVGPKITAAHEKINMGHRECFKLSKICGGLGAKVFGEDYKVPSAGYQLINNKLKEVAIHTKNASKKKNLENISTNSATTQGSEPVPTTSTVRPQPAATITETTSLNPKDKTDDVNSNIHRLSDLELVEKSCTRKSAEGLSREQVESLETPPRLPKNTEEEEKRKDTDISVDSPEGSSTPKTAVESNNRKEEEEVRKEPEASTSTSTTRRFHVIAETSLDVTPEAQRCKRPIEPYQSILQHLKLPR